MSDDAKSDKKPRETSAPWVDFMQRWERAVGEPVEQFVRSDAYFDAMTHVNRLRAQLTHRFEGAWEQWLHLFNLPAATDVRRLREQLSRLERQVNRIAKDLDDRAEEEVTQPRPKRATAKPKAPSSTKPSEPAEQ